MTIGLISSTPTRSASKTPARELSRLIKQRAVAEGFEKVGIVPAQTLENARDHLIEWLARGYHGAMSWMARRKTSRSKRGIVYSVAPWYNPNPRISTIP